MAELHIPDESLNLILTIGEGVYEHDDSARADARAIAAPVVAAYLIQLADEFRGEAERREEARAKREPEMGRTDRTSAAFNSAVAQAADVLRARAEAIEGEAR